MSYDTFSTSNFLRTAADAFSGTYSTPLTIVAWVKRSAAQWADTGNDFICDFNSGITSEADSMVLIANGGGADRVKVRVKNVVTDGGSQAIKTFADTTYDDIWVPIVGVAVTSTSRKIYVQDSTTPGTDTSLYAATALDTFAVGCTTHAQSGTEYAGKVAEVAVFDKELSTTEIDNLWTSANTGPAPNTVASADCIAYWSLNSDQASHADESGNGGPALAEVGTPTYQSDHPTITGGVTDVNLHGTCRGILRGIGRGIG